MRQTTLPVTVIVRQEKPLEVGADRSHLQEVPTHGRHGQMAKWPVPVREWREMPPHPLVGLSVPLKMECDLENLQQKRTQFGRQVSQQAGVTAIRFRSSEREKAGYTTEPANNRGGYT